MGAARRRAAMARGSAAKKPCTGGGSGCIGEDDGGKGQRYGKRWRAAVQQRNPVQVEDQEV
eukprot:1154028-Pelagomonas_calceolata.AAC.22